MYVWTYGLIRRDYWVERFCNFSIPFVNVESFLTAAAMQLIAVWHFTRWIQTHWFSGYLERIASKDLNKG